MIQEHYQTILNTPSDIRLDLPILYDLARQCEHITELGTGFGNSTAAFLAAQPKRLLSYDLRFLESALVLKPMYGATDFQLIEADDLTIALEPTDMIFIDTYHTYVQLSQELRLHAHAAKKFLAFHDTEVFGKMSEDNTRPGLVAAIKEFLVNNPIWQLKSHSNIHNGLTVLQKM